MKNPASLAYLYPSIPTRTISNRWQRYHEEILKKQLEDILRITGLYAIPGTFLSSSWKQKHQDLRLKSSNHVYYLLPRVKIPHTKRSYFRDHPETRIYREAML